jgi:FixJ family two-component response regulator
VIMSLRDTSIMNERPRQLITAVVDDDQRVLQSLENLLESAGHTVRLYESAMDLFASDSLADVDCLISDIDLPKIDGFELLNRACASRPDLLVILMTGHHELADRASSGEAARFRLLKKPFDAQELLSAISGFVQQPNRVPS